MSMHKIPMTGLERTGLIKHGLPIGAPSQLSDAFRNGVIHASKEIAELQAALADRDAKLAALDEATMGKLCIQRTVMQQALDAMVSGYRHTRPGYDAAIAALKEALK